MSSKLRFSDLVVLVSSDALVEKQETERVIRSLAAVTNEQLAHGTGVSIPGFGIFKPVVRRARTARNPKTGNPCEVPAKTVTKFVASK